MHATNRRATTAYRGTLARDTRGSAPAGRDGGPTPARFDEQRVGELVYAPGGERDPLSDADR